MAVAPINTRNYAWKDVEIRLAGKLLVSVEGVSWSNKQEKEFIYGKGVNPIDIKKGNKSVEGSLTLLQDELEQILDVSVDGTVFGLPLLDIQVAFAENDTIVRYSIVGVSFTEEPHDHNQNDKVARHQLPFMALLSRRVI